MDDPEPIILIVIKYKDLASFFDRKCIGFVELHKVQIGLVWNGTISRISQNKVQS